MDYDSAKTLSLIGLIFMVAISAITVLYIGFYVLMFGGMAATRGDSSGNGDVMIICLIALIIPSLLVLIIPGVNIYLAYNIHQEIKGQRLNEKSKKKLIAIVVLCFLGGGGLIPAVLYIIILASWKDIVHGKPPLYPYGLYPGQGGPNSLSPPR